MLRTFQERKKYGPQISGFIIPRSPVPRLKSSIAVDMVSRLSQRATAMEKKPRVFISYSHDSDEHKNWVLGLANQLRKEGVESWIDAYVESPPKGWQQWMPARVNDFETPTPKRLV